MKRTRGSEIKARMLFADRFLLQLAGDVDVDCSAELKEDDDVNDFSALVDCLKIQLHASDAQLTKLEFNGTSDSIEMEFLKEGKAIDVTLGNVEAPLHPETADFFAWELELHDMEKQAKWGEQKEAAIAPAFRVE